jgi:hypothetical protein
MDYPRISLGLEARFLNREEDVAMVAVQLVEMERPMLHK